MVLLLINHAFAENPKEDIFYAEIITPIIEGFFKENLVVFEDKEFRVTRHLNSFKLIGISEDKMHYVVLVYFTIKEKNKENGLVFCGRKVQEVIFSKAGSGVTIRALPDSFLEQSKVCDYSV